MSEVSYGVGLDPACCIGDALLDQFVLNPPAGAELAREPLLDGVQRGWGREFSADLSQEHGAGGKKAEVHLRDELLGRGGLPFALRWP
jgi:hypothetical protein